MPQFCILFYANYANTILHTNNYANTILHTILFWQPKGGMAQCPPKYAPGYC